MKKEYCVQNDGDCATCSLVNYGRDCMNRPIEADSGALENGGSRKRQETTLHGEDLQRGGRNPHGREE